MTQIDRRVVSEVLQVPVLGKSPDRQMEHAQWIAPQGTQGRFFCNLIGAFDVRFRLLPASDEVAFVETLAVSRRQIFDVKLIALLDDSRQTLIRRVSRDQNRGPKSEEMETCRVEISWFPAVIRPLTCL